MPRRKKFQKLEGFKISYTKFGYYLLAPGVMGNDGRPDIYFDCGIVKREINFKKAWEIGSNNLDMVMVSPDDDPIIPSGVKNPPVLELFKARETGLSRKIEE